MTKIVELRASGFARLTAVTIRPDGAMVEITGKNSAGKTSVLNAIWTALKGRAVAPAQPINKNAEEARLRVDLGTMVITRTFRRDKHDGVTTDLKVTMADGSRVGAKPQAMIDALLGDLSFNPLEFARLKPNEQFERVKQLVPGFNFAENAAARAEAFASRTAANAKEKTARARADGVVLPPGPKPKAVDSSKLAAQLQAALAGNRQNADRRALRQRALDEVEEKLNEAERLRAQAATLDKQAADETAAIERMPAVAADVDTDALAGQMASADGIRQAVARHEERDRLEAEAAEAVRLSATLTAFIDETDKERRDAIAKAKMPVKGLSFGDDEVLLNALPFSQAGTAEKIKASVGIAMALNPDLRVMLIDEGSELDSESRALVADLAEKQGYQVWMARVDESGAVGFVIEDGALAEHKEAAE